MRKTILAIFALHAATHCDRNFTWPQHF